MSKVTRIKDYDSFYDNYSKLDESMFDSLSGMFKSTADAFGGAIKQKLAAVMMRKIGIKEDSVFSGLIQEFVDAIPVMDIWDMVKMDPEVWNSKYLAPKLAEATQEFIERKGFDTLAEKLGIDSNGLIYSTIRELAHDKVAGKKTLTDFYTSLLGGVNMGKSMMKSIVADKDLASKEKNGSTLGDIFSSMLSGLQKA
jgi:hypothetical protein